MLFRKKQLNILIVEDNPADVFILDNMLRSSGLSLENIFTTDRIQDAAALLNTERVDLVFLDLSLPDSMGIDSFLRIRAFVHNIPVIILTGSSEGGMTREALKQGAQDYLVKGEFTIPLLLKTAEYSIERKKAEENKQREITLAVLQAQEQERKAIGEELHDNINQLLATSNLFLITWLNQKEDTGLIMKSTDYINEAIQEIRKLSKALITPNFILTELKMSIQDLARNIQLVKDIDIVIRVEDLDCFDLSDEMKLAIYRIIQEQLNNILKHANASRIEIEITTTQKRLNLLIIDNGNGFDTGKMIDGVGIVNMNSRVALFNGSVEIISAPGKGCRLDISMEIKAIKTAIAA